MAALFQKTYEELREAFVRARFTELNTFGRPDIEEWLENQHQDIKSLNDLKPWGSEHFKRYLAAVWDAPDSMYEVMGRMLRQHVTPLKKSPDWFTKRLFHREPYLLVMSAINAGSFEVYYPIIEEVDRVALIVWGRETLAVDIYEGSEKHSQFMGLRRARMWDVVQCFIDEYVLSYEKAAHALKFIRDEYKTAIRRERETAEHDFDTAVAVSEDGTKIVHADWVVIPQYGRHNAVLSLRIFEGLAFHHSKILRSSTNYARLERMLSVQGHYELARARNWSPKRQIAEILQDQQWLDQLQKHPNLQQYVSVPSLFIEGSGRHRQANVFITSNGYCPSPLPDGGVEIKL